MTHLLFTGPIVGELTTADGTTYDVSPAAIEIDPVHADELAHLIGLHWQANGHPEVEGDFIYNPVKDN